MSGNSPPFLPWRSSWSITNSIIKLISFPYQIFLEKTIKNSLKSNKTTPISQWGWFYCGRFPHAIEYKHLIKRNLPSWITDLKSLSLLTTPYCFFLALCLDLLRKKQPQCTHKDDQVRNGSKNTKVNPGGHHGTPWSVLDYILPVFLSVFQGTGIHSSHGSTSGFNSLLFGQSLLILRRIPLNCS